MKYRHLRLMAVLFVSAIVAYFVFQSLSGVSQGPTDKTKDACYDRENADLQLVRNRREGLDRSKTLAVGDDDRLSSGEDRKLVPETVEAKAPKGWRVVTWDGKHVAEAKVSATIASRELVGNWLETLGNGDDIEPEMIEVICGGDGTFDLPGAQSSVYVVNAEKNGYSSSCGVLDLSGPWPENFEICLGGSKNIEGVVVDASGNPVEGVEVWLSRTHQGSLAQLSLENACEILLFSRRRESGDDGSFFFEDAASYSNATIEVYHEPFMSVRKCVQYYDYRIQEVILKIPCVLGGRVLNVKGDPIEGASVFFRYPQDVPTRGELLRTDTEGKFLFNEAPEGLVHLMARHEKYGNSSRKIEVSSKNINSQDLVLPEGLSLTVSVVDDAGNPIKNMIVYVKDVETGTKLGALRTDDDGVAVMPCLNRGDMISLAVWENAGQYPMEFGFYSFVEDSRLDFVLKRKTELLLKVLDSETGDPIGKYKICLCPYHTFSSVQEVIAQDASVRIIECDDGKEGFAFLLAPNEVTDVTVHADGYVPSRVVIIDGFFDDDGIPVKTIRLTKSGFLTGMVVSNATGEPVEGAEVACYLTGRLDKRPSYVQSEARSATTGADGVFSLDSLSEGHFVLKVKAIGFAPAVVDSSVFDPTAPSNANTVRLMKECFLSGTVGGEDEKPLEAVLVKARIPGTNDFVSASTNLFGKYRIQGLPPGRIEVSAEDRMTTQVNRTQVKMTESITLAAGGAGEVDFYFGGSCQLSGWCTIEGRKAEWGMIICLYDEQGKMILRTNSSDSGYYKIDAVPSGVVEVVARSAIAGTGGCFRKTVELLDGDKKQINIDISGRCLHGQVRGPSGKPVDAALVELRLVSSGTKQSIITDHQGYYEALAMEEGEYNISARSDGCAEEVFGPYRLGGSVPDRELKFELKAGGTARVLVRDVGGEPVHGADIFLESCYQNGIRREATTGLTGICIFESLGIETMNLIAGAEGFAPSGVQFNAVPGEKIDPAIVLEDGGYLRVVVEGIDSKAVPRAFVTINGLNLVGYSPRGLASLGFLAPSRKDFRTDNGGHFTIGILPPGTFTIKVEKGSLSGETSATVAVGKMAVVRLRLQ
jgi:hypothetical protein